MSKVLDNLINLLKLEKLDDLLFRGESQDLGLRQVFGGQVIAQALSAAIQVVPKERKLHSCHAYFLSAGDSQLPIIYDVQILREGRSFTAVRVNAIQHNQSLCHITISFQLEENGFEHQSMMPNVGQPEDFISEKTIINKLASYIPETIRDKFTAERPFNIHSKYINNPFQGSELPPEQYVWFKANGKAPLDQAIQQCLLAYFSDFHILLTALHPHQKGLLEQGMKVATIDHSIWFHRSLDLNNWLLYAIESNNAFGARGLSRGQLFDQQGRLIATTQQEGLIRYTPPLKK
ncbi:acyl-CoA thioesterase-2 [Bisgaardia hudsonensis]|uniref:Acyl-CoA thioesterase 2 n=1 Tax=Bisgaardia hudsonensis TaxID=109472 RepID=A0A4R2MZT6_9PAST|nr:acyl-CoA thioesterase II [Bisgaardia hudsonensis]QLB12894.1 acyl-CoA thioesterase II [Bisgaardia hudsonensis]TCP11308.1 acyl-CoA thioesterase-2 [Bisgaardia hudsonensis]